MLNQLEQQQIQKATELILQNEVVAMPTETVYGLAARIDNIEAIEKIFSTKKRPFFDPLIVHVSSIEQAKSCVSNWPAICDVLAAKFWPGPLTFVLPKADHISDKITSGLQTVAVRWPKHELAEALIKAVGIPLAAPSANMFGKTSPTKADHVKREFGGSVFVIDSEPSEVGIESTVLLVKENIQTGLTELSILRKGIVLKSEITTLLQNNNVKFNWLEAVDKKESPGHMKHHYMPEIPLVICKNKNIKLSELALKLNEKLNELPDQVEGVRIVKPKGEIKNIQFLKLPTDPVLAARELYAQLRLASMRKPDALCFIHSEEFSSEMWESVFDRLYKAASLVLE